MTEPTAASQRHNELLKVVVKEHFKEILGDDPQDGVIDVMIYVESVVTAAVVLAFKLGVPPSVTLNTLNEGIEARLKEALHG